MMIKMVNTSLSHWRFALLALLCVCPLAADAPAPSHPSNTFSDNAIKVKAAYYYPVSSDFRKVYSGNGQYGLELDCQIWKSLSAWVEANYFTSSGHTIGGHDRTRITMVPISVGAKYAYKRYFAQPYVGAGVLASYVHIQTDSHYLIHSQSKWGVGGLFKLGCDFNVSPRLVIDTFIDYAQQHIRMDNNHHKKVVISSLNVSGLSFGVGAGYRF